MSKKNTTPPSFAGNALGDHVVPHLTFPHLTTLFKTFDAPDFQRLNDLEKNDRLCRSLLDLIQTFSDSQFVLSPIIDYIEHVNHKKLIETFTFSSFEMWLNQFSGLSKEDNARIRGKIAGKWLPRDAYQLFFPIGMGKVYPGSHFVTAHSSPDLDTTVASFWGWMDAFAARVSQHLHIWNVPGGAPAAAVEVALLFENIFGKNLFQHLAKTKTSLTLSSLDFLNQKGVVKRSTEESILTSDHERDQNAIVLVDKQGYFLGDWRNFDVEGMGQVVTLLNQCLRWFENDIHARLIALFTKPTLAVKDLKQSTHQAFSLKIADCEPAKGYGEKQKKLLQDFLSKVLGVKKGLQSTFEEFSLAMKHAKLSEFETFMDLVEALEASALFDGKGHLVENRPLIFQHLEKIFRALDLAIQSVGTYVERFDIALSIKTEVFRNAPHVINYRSELEEMRSKMGNYPYLTVTQTDKEGRYLPLGVVYANDLHQPVLGTVSLRDFCNREETKIPSYLEVISVIDHHKSALNTLSAPTAWISDAQSSNALVATLAFEINDHYTTGGMTQEEIAEQMAQVSKDLSSTQSKRVMQRLLKKQIAAEKNQGYYIDPLREFVEYLHFLYAILDDTDLLTKVSSRDVEVVATLLNRLKSLTLKKEVEIIAFDDLARDLTFVKKAAERILQNPDMYSLYRKIYLSKEDAVSTNLELSSQGAPSTIFADTKEQNGCCRVGQTKIFARNVSTFEKHAPKIRAIWTTQAQGVYKQKNEVDLHMHMISTVAGAEDLFSGTAGGHAHKDELWIWIPGTEQSIEHLKSFLNAFRTCPQLANDGLEVEFLGENAKLFDEIFTESFLPIPHSIAAKQTLPIAVLRFKAGMINSRKAMISPYLPRLVQ